MTVDLAPAFSFLQAAWPPLIVLVTALVTNHFNTRSNREARKHDAELEEARAERALSQSAADHERAEHDARDAASVAAAEEALLLLKEMHQEIVLARAHTGDSDLLGSWSRHWETRVFQLRYLAFRSPRAEYREIVGQAFDSADLPWFAPHTSGPIRSELDYLDMFADIFSAQLRSEDVGEATRNTVARFLQAKRDREAGR